MVKTSDGASLWPNSSLNIRLNMVPDEEWPHEKILGIWCLPTEVQICTSALHLTSPKCPLLATNTHKVIYWVCHFQTSFLKWGLNNLFDFRWRVETFSNKLKELYIDSTEEWHLTILQNFQRKRNYIRGKRLPTYVSLQNASRSVTITWGTMKGECLYWIAFNIGGKKWWWRASLNSFEKAEF